MTPIRERTKSGKIIWRVKYRVEKRRVRKTFRTREEARDWIDENADIAETEGRTFWMAWRALTSTERHELMDALVIMRQTRLIDPKANLVDAANADHDRRTAKKKSILLKDAYPLFLKSTQNRKRKGSVSAGWHKVLETCLGTVVRDLPNKTLVEFIEEELEIYLEDRMEDEEWAPRTFNNYRDHISSLFEWGLKEDYLEHNPAAKIEKFSKKVLEQPLLVPEVEAVGRVLKLTQRKRSRSLQPAVDLGFGFALRSSEINGMNWEDVNEEFVHVPAAIAKNGIARTILRTPLTEGVFRSLLAAKKSAHKGRGAIMYKGWRRDLTELFEEAGLGKPRNVMRKSGASYHYHATGNEALTREMTGHTAKSKVFGSSYKAMLLTDGTNRTPITQTDGLAYYELWKKR
jgi:integrase